MDLLMMQNSIVHEAQFNDAEIWQSSKTANSQDAI